MNILIYGCSIALLLLLTCCGDKNAKSEEPSFVRRGEFILELQQRIRRKGDVEAYLQLRTIYSDFPPQEFLFWAMLMANDYNYPEAYLDVYNTMMSSYGKSEENFSDLSERTKIFLLEYVNSAANKGVQQASEILKEIQ